MITNAKIIGEGIDYEAYSRQEPSVKRGNPLFSMSRGEIVNFASNPRRWLDGYKEDGGETKSTIWGSLIDCMVTAPEKFDKLFAVAPETYPDSKTGEPKPFTMSSNWCKAWAAEQGEKTVIKQPDYDEAKKAFAVLGQNPIASQLIKESQKQVMVIGFWSDESTGIQIPIRCLIDMLPINERFKKWIVDFKTARDGSPNGWAKVACAHGYDVQAALTMDLYAAATGEERIDFVHIVQENVAPYHVTDPLPEFSAEFIEWGRSKYRMALKNLCQCIERDEWPSFNTTKTVMQYTQLIEPDRLWEYREMAGSTEFVAPPERKAQSDDIAP